MFDLSGKTVVITGGGRGIGRAIVCTMARAGANIVAAGRTQESLESVTAEARSLGARAIAVQTDITERSDLDRLVERALGMDGYIHCWINNAGSARPDDVGPLLNLTETQWDAVVDLNLKWAFFAAQAAARTMHGGGSIINISSRSGSQPNPMTGQYGAAKAGLENLTSTMAVEWGHLGIRVNAIAPGVVLTPESASTGTMRTEGRRRRQIDMVPLRRLGQTDDIAAACVFFASDEASWITGEVLHITGGSRITVGYLSYLHRIAAQAEAGPPD